MMNLFLSSLRRPFVPSPHDLAPFAVECCLITTLVAVLLTPFVTRKANSRAALVSILGFTVALVVLLYVGLPVFNPARPPLGGLLIADSFALLWRAMLLVFGIGVVLMTFSTTAGQMKADDGPIFFTLLVGATLGMTLMASTTNLLMIVMAVELASLPSYVLAGFRKTHRLGAEASLKYVLFGAVCSALMIYALTFFYGLYGSLELSTIAGKIAAGSGSPVLLAIPLFGIVVGVGFKISAVPFHFWCPDVFEGASVEVSLFLSVASKGAGLMLLLRILMTLADALHYQVVQPLTALALVIGAIGALTATVGNVAAFTQSNIKRLLAYSSIAHAGYMLCALAVVCASRTPVTSAGTNFPAQSLLLYLAVYLFMNLGAFTVSGLVQRNTGSEELSPFKGLARRNPLLAHCMFCFMFSLVGLPPFAGFNAKFSLLMLLVNAGGWYWLLVAAIAINTVLSLYYYVRVIRMMYLDPPERPAFVSHPLGTALAVCCAAVLVVMFILGGQLSELTQRYARLQNVSGV